MVPGSPEARAQAGGGTIQPVAADGPRTLVRYVIGCDRLVADVNVACGAPCPPGTSRQIPYSTTVQPGQDPPGDLTAWNRGTPGCYPPPTPGAPDTVLPAIDPQDVAAVFQATITPAQAWAHTAQGDIALVQMPFIVYATIGQRQWTDIALPGGTVDIRATPTTYTWTFGDGSDPITTTDPGAWYPEHTVFHEYTQAGTYTTQLSTTFTGEYAVAGGPWLPIPGTATATSPTDPVTIVEARAVLTN